MLGCAVVLVASVAVTYAVEQKRARSAKAAQVPAPAPAHPSREPIGCDSLLAARRTMLGQGFDVAAADSYNGRPATVVFAGNTDAWRFRTKIREAMQGGVNFAGHFVVAAWDCGTDCQQHAIVDAKTGAIVEFGLETEMGVDHSPLSRLLITNPKKNVPASDTTKASSLELALKYSRIPREYFELVEGRGSSYLNRVCVENAFGPS